MDEHTPAYARIRPARPHVAVNQLLHLGRSRFEEGSFFDPSHKTTRVSYKTASHTRTGRFLLGERPSSQFHCTVGRIAQPAECHGAPGSSSHHVCTATRSMIAEEFNHMPRHRVFNNLGKCKLERNHMPLSGFLTW